jgi:hypothetical protein
MVRRQQDEEAPVQGGGLFGAISEFEPVREAEWLADRPRFLELMVTGPRRCEREAPDLLRLSRERLPIRIALRHTSGISG